MRRHDQGPDSLPEFRYTETGSAGACYETPAAAAGKNHKKKDHLRTLELAYRDQIIGGLRDHGASYTDIRKTLGITARQVEAALGEAQQLQAVGHTVADVARRIGLPCRTAHDLLKLRPPATLPARSNTAIAVLVDMYGMQVDVLAELLDMQKTHVYKLIRDLRRDGLVMPRLIEVQPGAKWVIPTGETAASYLGWRPRTVWRPPLKDADHYRAVAQARIMLVGTDPRAWISERQLRHEAEIAARQSGSRVVRSTPMGGAHIHDGRFLGVVDGTYGWWALEVELTAKSSTNMDKALQGAIRAARDAEPEPMIGVLYLVRGREVDRVVTAAAGRLPRELEQLDMHLAVLDFEQQWKRFIDARRALCTGKRAEHKRGNVIHLSRDAS